MIISLLERDRNIGTIIKELEHSEGKASEGSAVSMKKIRMIEAKIVKDLLEVGRKTFTDIAKECGVSASII